MERHSLLIVTGVMVVLALLLAGAIVMLLFIDANTASAPTEGTPPAENLESEGIFHSNPAGTVIRGTQGATVGSSPP